MSVLLIGATGFVGSAIHAALIAAGHKVLSSYHRGRQPGWPQHNTSWHRIDLGLVRENAPLPPLYHCLFWTWFAFGFPAFAAVVVIFWLMITKP